MTPFHACIYRPPRDIFEKIGELTDKDFILNNGLQQHSISALIKEEFIVKFARFSTYVFCTAVAISSTSAAVAGEAQSTRVMTNAHSQIMLQLTIDARDVDRAIYRGTMVMPVENTGPSVIQFPKWVPGHHAPSGPISRIAAIHFYADNTEIAWKRDTLDMFAFHVDPPDAATSIRVDFQYLSPTAPDMGRIEMTANMIDLQWTSLAPYPKGFESRDITVQASVTFPEGWQFATALEQDKVTNGTINFKPVKYDVLVDSPIVAGRFARTEILDGSPDAPVTLNLFADASELLEVSDDQIEAHRRLIRQSYKLFKSRHFDHYNFLVGLSSEIGGLGAEHHRSSENFTTPTYFTDWEAEPRSRELLPHEFVHSWNGKFRRGADLLTPTLNQPMQNSLLWVYEGLTRYLGSVLAVRSGLNTLEEGRDNFAASAALMANRAGRNWRPLSDTTNHSIYAEGPQPWPNWQRGADYYLEGQLLWLDVDTLMRDRSKGARSLNDFAAEFFSINDGSFDPVPYTFEDVVNTLNEFVPYDWATYFHDRVDKVAVRPPLDGLVRGGYRLVYTETPSDYFKSLDARKGLTNLSYSLGIKVDEEGNISDVRWESPAFSVALTIGTKILAVNGQMFETPRLVSAVRDCKGKTTPLSLLVKRREIVREVGLDCSSGLRFPHLVRDSSKPALLDEILAPMK